MSTAQSILIVDSEADGRTQLRQTLEGLRGVFPHQIVGEADSARSALAQIRSLRPSVLLVDPALPDMNGIELGRQLATARSAGSARELRWPEHAPAPSLIYVSGSDRHALDAFEVSALDYLLKPVHPDRLLKALTRTQGAAFSAAPPNGSDAPASRSSNGEASGAYGASGPSGQGSGNNGASGAHTGALEARLLTAPASHSLLQGPASAPQRPAPRRHFAVHERGRLMLVPVEQAIYLKAELKYVTVRTRQREYLIEDSLTALEGEFGDRFVRIHRNALVARAAVAGFERVPPDGRGIGSDPHWQVVLRDVVERLPVSRRQWATVRNLMG
jgi:two-component system response regulator AlgR